MSVLVYYFMLRFLIDGIICVSRDLAFRLKFLIGSRKVQIIHNGLEIINNPEDDVCKAPEKRGCFVIGTIGRLDKVKGHSLFLKAAWEILQIRDNIVFHIIGSGPFEQILRDEAYKLRIADKVHFFGFREDIPRLVEMMDIFVLSSLHEGIPFSLLEAMSMSKPVICTRVGGIKEVLEENVDGLLVPPLDSRALSTAILWLLENPECAVILGKNAREKVVANFSAALMTKETEELYGHIITSQGTKLRGRDENGV